MTTKRHQCHRLKVDLQDKKNLASKIDKYKVQLITCGFTQVQGVDYYEMCYDHLFVSFYASPSYLFQPGVRFLPVAILLFRFFPISSELTASFPKNVLSRTFSCIT